MVRSTVVVLVIALLFAGGTAGCSTACPAALFEGVLTRQGDDLVVVSQGGNVEPVAWSQSGHGIRSEGGKLVVTEWGVLTKAREGDFVRLGGGELRTGVWTVCGQFDVMHAD